MSVMIGISSIVSRAVLKWISIIHYGLFLSPPPFYHPTVPPKWTIEPADVDIERNRQLIIDCQADGVPKPTVVWKKATGQYLEHNIINIITYKYYFIIFIESEKVYLFLGVCTYSLFWILTFLFVKHFLSYCLDYYIICIKPVTTYT